MVDRGKPGIDSRDDGSVTAERSDLLLVQGLSDKMHQLEHVLMCEIDAHRE